MLFFFLLEMTSRRLPSFVEDLVVEVSNNRNLFHIFECVLRLHRLDERSHGRCQFLLKMFCYMVILKKFVFRKRRYRPALQVSFLRSQFSTTILHKKLIFLSKNVFEDGNLENAYIFSGKGAMDIYTCSIKQTNKTFYCVKNF